MPLILPSTCLLCVFNGRLPFSLTLHLETQRLSWGIIFKTRLCHLTLLAFDRFSTATKVSIQNNCELCQKVLLTSDSLCSCSCLLSNVMFDQPCVQRCVSETCCCHKMQRQQDFVPFTDRQCGSLYPSKRLYSPGLETIERFVLARRQSQGLRFWSRHKGARHVWWRCGARPGRSYFATHEG